MSKTSQLEASKSIVRVGCRLFLVRSHLAGTKLHRGMVIPLFVYRHGRDIGDRSVLSYKIYDIDVMQGPLAIVQTIAVTERFQRRGWGGDMVRALIKLYPDRVWEVESPNDASFAMFVDLSNKFSNNVSQPQNRY